MSRRRGPVPPDVRRLEAERLRPSPDELSTDDKINLLLTTVIALLYRELRTFHPRAGDRKGGTS